MTKHSVFFLSFKKLVFLSLCLFLLTSHAWAQTDPEPPTDGGGTTPEPIDDGTTSGLEEEEEEVTVVPEEEEETPPAAVEEEEETTTPSNEEEEETTPETQEEEQANPEAEEEGETTPDTEEEEEEEDVPTDPGRADISFSYDSYLRFHWKGGLTSHSITLKVFPTTDFSPANKARYVARYTKIGEKTVNAADLTITPVLLEVGPTATIEFTGLIPAQKYYYMFLFVPNGASAPTAQDFYTKVGGDTTGMEYEFSFKTMGTALTAASFTFGVGCCAQTNSNNEVFQTLAERGLDFFIYAGDMHGEKINTESVSVFYDAYNRVFGNTKQKAFFQSTPLVYVWDDKDAFARGNSSIKSYATSAYKTYVPCNTLKNPLPVDDKTQGVTNAPAATAVDSSLLEAFDGAGTNGIFRSFLHGRCLFIILDLRSFKDLNDKDILGSNQANWLKNQLVFASKNAGVKQVFLVSTLAWNNKDADTDWSEYETAQNNIASWVSTYINTGGITTNKNIMLLGGGGGFIAFDDGSNNGHGKFPVVQAGALDDTPSCQGGAYSHGLVKGRQQFGQITVTDNGNTVCVKVKLERNGAPLIQYDTCSQTSYEGVKDTCSSSILDSINDAIIGEDDEKVSKVWKIIAIVALAVLGAVVLIMFICLIVNCCKNRRSNGGSSGNGGRLSEDDIYLEMTERKGKKKKNSKIKEHEL